MYLALFIQAFTGTIIIFAGRYICQWRCSLANLHLLFWLSLIPFATAWMGENYFAPPTIALYGFILLMNGIAYSILSTKLIRLHSKNSALGAAVGNGAKGKISVAIYATAILLSFVNSWISFGLYVTVACIWFIPNKRIEQELDHDSPVNINK